LKVKRVVGTYPPCFNLKNKSKMKINKIGAKIVIPTIIIFKDFVSLHWWCYELVLFEKTTIRWK